MLRVVEFALGVLERRELDEGDDPCHVLISRELARAAAVHDGVVRQ